MKYLWFKIYTFIFKTKIQINIYAFNIKYIDLCIFKLKNIYNMKIHILALFLAFLFISVHAAEDRDNADDDDEDDDDITTLTFLVEYEPEPDNDHIDIGLTVEARDTSLKSAIEKVT